MGIANMKDDLKRVNKRLDILMKELSSLKAAHRDLKKKVNKKSWLRKLFNSRFFTRRYS